MAAAGVGKTRLVAEVAGLARLQGAVVASSQCFGTSGRLALAPVADWLRNPAVRLGGGDPRPGLARRGRQAGARRRAVARTSGPDRRAMADAWQRHRFFEGLARALLAVGRPILLVLDNMQWCDQETLAFITFCLGLADGAPLLVAGTLRDDGLDDDPELGELDVRMRATGLLTELSLSPLDAADTARLAEAISGRPLRRGGQRACCRRRRAASRCTSSRQCAAPTTRAARRCRPAIWPRCCATGLSRRPRPAREVAGLAAAVGTNFTLDLLTEASDLEADAVVEAVDELWRRRIMREFGDGYDFSHDLLREAAYAQVSPPKRWLLHRRIAQGLELLHADDTDPVSAQLAEQYARGGRPGRAVTYYRRAAEVAAAMFAHAEAIRLHEKALSIVAAMPAGRTGTRGNSRSSKPWPRRSTPGTATRPRSCSGRWSARSTWRSHWAARTPRSPAWPRSGRRSSSRGEPPTATRQPAARWRWSTADSELSGPAHFAVGGSAVSLGMPAEGLRHLELAAELASGAVSLSVGTRPDVHGTAWSAHAHWLLGRDDDALASLPRRHRAGPGDRPPVQPGRGAGLRRHHPPDARRLPGLRDTVGELRELCDRYGFAYYREWGLILDGWSRADGPGIDLARQGIGNLKADGLVRPHAVLAVAARRPAGPRRPAGRGTGDPRRRARRRAARR